MSFNSFTITRNNETIPYIDSNVEVGYFGTLGYVNNSTWNSMPITFLTNNGVAYGSSDGYGITFKNSGIYRLTLGLSPNASGNGGALNGIYFCFGTTKLVESTNNNNTLSNSTIYMNSYSNVVTSKPGIITWNVSSYSNGNSTPGNYSYDPNGIHYLFYSKANNDGYQYPGILSSILTITTNAEQTIYFNIGCNNGLDMGNSYFTLEMISSINV